MSKTIFYSWQSDLPNNTNRGLIEDCIKKAIKNVTNLDINLDVVLDRDTKGIVGTPDIVNTLFKKIEKADIFIADVSIVNPNYEGRKSPNPNVLIELDYAAKCLGWENVICLFNSDYSTVEELPFDLKFRRPVIYKVGENKSQSKKLLIEIVQNQIVEILNKQHKYDEIEIHLKQQVDTLLIGLGNSILKILYQYQKPLAMETFIDLLTITAEEIEHQLFETKLLGFSVLKDYSNELRKLNEILEKPFFLNHSNDDYKIALLNIIRALEMFIILNKEELFNDFNNRVGGYRIIDAHLMNADNPKDSYIIGPPENGSGVKALDWGTIRKYNIRKCLNLVHFKSDYLKEYVQVLFNLISCIEKWGTVTKRGFIIDPMNFKSRVNL